MEQTFRLQVFGWPFLFLLKDSSPLKPVLVPWCALVTGVKWGQVRLTDRWGSVPSGPGENPLEGLSYECPPQALEETGLWPPWDPYHKGKEMGQQVASHPVGLLHERLS